MLDIVQSLYLTDILHLLTQSLLAPVVILLLLFMGYALFIIGSILVETFTERRNFKVEMPKFSTALTCANEDELADTIIDSGLLRRQKVALLTLWGYRQLPADTLQALAKRLIAVEEAHYARIVGQSDTAARLAPMIGLMGTLIPLGPGIVALGQNQTDVLAASIGVAFDTTVAGLAAASVALVVSKIRRAWYENYLDALETAMMTLLEKITRLRESGCIVVCDETVDVDDIIAQAEQEMRDKGIELKELAGNAKDTNEAAASSVSTDKDAVSANADTINEGGVQS